MFWRFGVGQSEKQKLGRNVKKRAPISADHNDDDEKSTLIGDNGVESREDPREEKSRSPWWRRLIATIFF